MNDPHPQVSVIIGVKDRKEQLRRCLISLFSQVFTDFEVIVVDYGGSDTGLKDEVEGVGFTYIHSYASVFSRSKALNIGIRAAKGEYILCARFPGGCPGERDQEGPRDVPREAIRR
jgi:glycosyltransferase involved in cell wall biosynthesis